MINFEFSGNIPSMEKQKEMENNFLEVLGLFKEEFENNPMTFVFHSPPLADGKDVTFSYQNGTPTFDFVRRFNHYQETGEYIKPQ